MEPVASLPWTLALALTFGPGETTAMPVRAPTERSQDTSTIDAPASPDEEPAAVEAAPSPIELAPAARDEEPAADVETVPRPAAPPMPDVEELPPREPVTEPIATETSPDTGNFFDPNKLAGTGPSGGVIQIHGFAAAGFFVAQRTDLRRRNSDGTLPRLDSSPFFALGSATLYVGAPIYADIVYARIGVEFIALPQPAYGSNLDIIAPSRRYLFFETGALEVNPFAAAKRLPRWIRNGFKITAGVFIVPFGLEDESHAAPVQWFITRAPSMTIGRVYPGTWTDVGVTVSWAPTFGSTKTIRPIAIDVGAVNGDACTQTRFIDQLYSTTGVVARCERRRRPEERIDGAAVLPDDVARIDGPGGIVLPDNNGGKSVVARVRVFPLPALDLGGSFVWGTHPQGEGMPPAGQSTNDLQQAPSWRVGAHLDLDFEAMFAVRVPLPRIRGELVYGRDDAVRGDLEQVARVMLGGYAQIAQPLFRRRRSRLPGLILQYRFDHADPDTRVPGTVGGVPLVSDVTSTVYVKETAQQSHAVGLRFPVLPRFTLKAEYVWLLEDGGARNQQHNDVFGIEAVADF